MKITNWVLACAMFGGEAAALQESAPPNVALFVIDDVADSDIDAIRTPALDELAKQGIRFRRAYSHAWCSPSRDSLLFSSWNGRHRGKDCDSDNPNQRSPAAFTIAKLFQSGGYTTAHFGKWHVGASPGSDWKNTPHVRGFDRSICNMTVGVCEGMAPNRSRKTWRRLDDGVTSYESRHSTIALKDELQQWWSEVEGPKFAMVHFRAAHAPFQVPPDELLYDWAKSERRRSQRRKFELEVISVDHVIGDLLPVLGDDTIVVFMSDNGTPGADSKDESGNRVGDFGVATRDDQDPEHVKLSCYEDGVRIPFIIMVPGIAGGFETDALMHIVDLLPSFGDLLDIPFEAAVDGVSFAPALHGKPGNRDWVFVHSPGRHDKALITDRWKLLINKRGEQELYDLEQDPGETTPLPLEGEKVNYLRSLLSGVQAGFR